MVPVMQEKTPLPGSALFILMAFAHPLAFALDAEKVFDCCRRDRVHRNVSA